MKDSVYAILAMIIQNVEYFKNQVKRLDKLIARESNAIPQTLNTIPASALSLLPGLPRVVLPLR